MTLIIASVHASGTIIVADRAREVGGSGPPIRDDSARKLVLASSGSIAIAIVGDVILGAAGSPETVVSTWMSAIEAADPKDRARDLCQRAKTNCGRPSDNRIGLLLLFDRCDSGRVTTVTISAASTATGVSASLMRCDLSRMHPTVWGLKDDWASLSTDSWDSTKTAHEQLESIRNAIATYAAGHSGEIVSATTCDAIV